MRYFHAMWNPMYVHNVQCSGGVFIQVCVCSVTARGQCLLRKPLPIPMQVIHLHITLVDCPPWINSTQSNHIPMQVIHLIFPAQNSPIDFLVFIFNACALRKQIVNNQKNLVKLVNLAKVVNLVSRVIVALILSVVTLRHCMKRLSKWKVGRGEHSGTSWFVWN